MQEGDAATAAPGPEGTPLASRTVLVIGHSHVGCLAAAARNTHATNFQIVSIANVVGRQGRQELPEHEILQAVLDHVKSAEPDALCLCLRGNQHNILGITESPRPFSIGEAEAGAAPRDGKGRHFIPYQLMKAHFRSIVSREMIHAFYDAFPRAARYYVNAPPPVSDWEHIKANPSIFSEKLKLGPAPAALRLQLYRCQTEVLRDCAREAGAVFIDPPPRTFDPDGFLARRYYSTDPTHANALYGEVMLETILETVGAGA